MERPERNIEPEKIPEAATDMETALFLSRHIDNPCGVEVGEGQRMTIRGFYLREAKRRLSGMTNESARAFLEAKIKEYEI